VELLEQARHGADDGGAHLEHVRGQSVDRSGVGDRGAFPKVTILDHPLVDVRQRQERQTAIPRREWDGVAAGGDVVGEVAVRQHHPLGAPGRARRVDEAREVAGRGLPELRVRGGAGRGAGRDHRLPGPRAWRRCVEHRRVAESCQARAHRLDLGRLLGRRDQCHGRARIAEDVFDLVRKERRVDRHGHSTRGEDGVIGDRPLGAVLGQDRHPIAGPDAERLESARGVAHGAAELTGGDRGPGALLLVQQEVGLRRFGLELAEDVAEGAKAHRRGNAAARSARRRRRARWRRRSELNRCMEVLQTSALPLGYAARTMPPTIRECRKIYGRPGRESTTRRPRGSTKNAGPSGPASYVGAGNGSRTRDFNLGKVALYH
jgi:hypothetical protein